VSAPRHADARVARVITFFEGLQRSDLARLAELYVDQARFKDPFNDVHTRVQIERIFSHMFATLGAPRFEIRDVVAQGDQCFLSWDFRFRLPRLGADEQLIHGATHLHFADDGRIAQHRDYWDAAEELYQKLPLVGALMRWLRRRASA
jgi:ketosteroid isomerase-like protein